jgi:glycosyltransferase involved in cell wall biosynthesis
LQGADLFLFYNGSGLDSARWFRRQGGLTIVEAVNSQVQVQEQILREEHQMLGLPWRPFHRRETRRRVAEVEEADYVLVPSTFVARSFLAKGIPAGRLLRVPYPVQKIVGATKGEPRAASCERRASADEIFRVLYVGTISVRKGLRYLIEAFRQLRHPKKELWIVGPAASPSGIENLALPEGVKFWGPLKGDALQTTYQQSTVFCLPSVEEGLALVLSEALSYGVPVIATQNTGIEDLLVEGKGGMVVPIRDAAAIGDCLNRLAEDGDFLRTKKREAAAWSFDRAGHFETTPALAATLLETFRKHRPN